MQPIENVLPLTSVGYFGIYYLCWNSEYSCLHNAADLMHLFQSSPMTENHAELYYVVPLHKKI